MLTPAAVTGALPGSNSRRTNANAANTDGTDAGGAVGVAPGGAKPTKPNSPDTNDTARAETLGAAGAGAGSTCGLTTRAACGAATDIAAAPNDWATGLLLPAVETAVADTCGDVDEPTAGADTCAESTRGVDTASALPLPTVW